MLALREGGLPLRIGQKEIRGRTFRSHVTKAFIYLETIYVVGARVKI